MTNEPAGRDGELQSATLPERVVTVILHPYGLPHRGPRDWARGNGRGMTEETIFKTMDMPEGQDWAWHPDLNLVALSNKLDCAGKLRAFEEVQRHWARAHLSVVESA